MKESIGDFIVFLDQDDWINENYIASQLSAIQGNDCVLCMAMNGEKEFYTDLIKFRNIMNKEILLGEGNPIISPGQALIRKSVIPDKWLTNVLKHNGADDWYLWICMFAEEKKFIVNETVLYKHTLGEAGENASGNLVEIMLSINEMLDIVENNNILNTVDYELLKKGDLNIRSQQLRLLENKIEFNKWLSIWMDLRDRGANIADYLRQHEIHRIAIYGAGKMGGHLYYELKDKTEVSYFIDRDIQKTVVHGKPVYPIEKLTECRIKEIDAIIISNIQKPYQIINDLKRLEIKIIVLIDILKNMTKIFSE